MGHAAGAMEYGLHLLDSADAPELEEVAIGSCDWQSDAARMSFPRHTVCAKRQP